MLGALGAFEWDSQHRGLAGIEAAGISGSGPAFGTAVSAVIIAWLVSTIGWRLAFVFSGALGFIWVAVWLLVYRAPEEATWLQPAERRLILTERYPGGTSDSGGMKLKELLGYQTMWGLFLVQGCVNYTKYLFLTWLPTYLVQSRGLNIMHSGLQTGLFYFGAHAADIALGRLCDHLLTPAAVQAGKRHYAVVILAFGTSVMVLAPYTASATLLLVEITMSLACVQSVFVNTYSLTNDLLHAGKSIGTAVGWIQLGGNIFGLVAPIATGYIVAATGSFTSAFLLAGGLLIIGAGHLDDDPPAGRRTAYRGCRIAAIGGLHASKPYATSIGPISRSRGNTSWVNRRMLFVDSSCVM